MTTLLHETQDVLMVDLWYSKYMVYSLRAFFTAAHFFIGGIVPEILIIHDQDRPKSGPWYSSGTIPPIKKWVAVKNALGL